VGGNTVGGGQRGEWGNTVGGVASRWVAWRRGGGWWSSFGVSVGGSAGPWPL